MANGNTIQRNHKDTVFNDLFSDKRNALALYNALNGTEYEDADSLEIVTLSDAIYMHGKNDISVQYVREYQKAGDSLPVAMDKAIDRCTEEGVLKEYLLKKKSEVKLMLLTEFDEEAFAETMREEGKEERRRRARISALFQTAGRKEN